jgi:hypothetical protein
MDSDRFDRLEALLSAKLDAQTQQVAELQKEVALLRTAQCRQMPVRPLRR